MQLSNYILYGTTAIILCVAIGYSVHIALQGDPNPNPASVVQKSSFEKISDENKNLRAEFNQLVADKEDAEEALGKATEVSKKRNGEIAKLEDQLANLTEAKQSPTDILNHQIVSELLQLLKCPITELANRTKFSLDQNVSLQKLLTNANQKLSESQREIETLSRQVSRLRLTDTAITQTNGKTPLIPPLTAGGIDSPADGKTEQKHNLDDSVPSGITRQLANPNLKTIKIPDSNKKLRETATRSTPSENEIALSRERERLLSVVSELQSELKNRENLLFAQTSLIEDLKKRSPRIETTFRQNVDGTIRNVSPQPFREIGTFKSISK